MRRKLAYLIAILLLAGCGGTAAPDSSSFPPLTAAETTNAPATAAPFAATAGPLTAVQPTETAAGPTVAAAVQDSPSNTESETAVTPARSSESEIREYDVPTGSHPHDVAPAPDGTVWYTAQHKGELGRLDPVTGAVHHIPLGRGSAPHGVIVGPDGAAWVTDGGLNAIVRVDAATEEVQTYPLPAGIGSANLNTAVFDQNGILWFTGQNGFYGRLDSQSGEMALFNAPRGRGPYGITATPDGTIYYASLAGSYVGRLDKNSGEATVLEPPTPGQGARRVWSDSRGRIWTSEWNAGQLAVFDPESEEWREWALPGDRPQPYAIYVDEQDIVWLSDFGANALVRFDPAQETFQLFPIPTDGAAVRQILGRQGEIWGAESATDKLIVIRTGT